MKKGVRIHECEIALADGRKIRCPAWPLDCEYVRIVDANDEEEVYWHFNEWQEEPQEVMGAFMGALTGAINTTVKPDNQEDTCHD